MWQDLGAQFVFGPGSANGFHCSRRTDRLFARRQVAQINPNYFFLKLVREVSRRVLVQKKRYALFELKEHHFFSSFLRRGQNWAQAGKESTNEVGKTLNFTGGLCGSP